MGTAYAQPLDGPAIDSPTRAIEFFSATDSYASAVTDTCTLIDGFPLVVTPDVGDVQGTQTIVVGGREVIVAYPGDVSGLPYWGGAEIEFEPGHDAQDIPACCGCGIVDYDPRTGAVKFKGCVAFTKPCCCTAVLYSTGTIQCYCVGGSSRCFS